jgi:uncharacterized membrane protein
VSDALDRQIEAFERRLRELERELDDLRRASSLAAAEVTVAAALPAAEAPPVAATVAPVTPVASVAPPAPAATEAAQEIELSPWLQERLELVRARAADGEFKKAFKLLDLARARAALLGEIDALRAVLRLVESIGGEAPPALQAQGERLAYATTQNILFAERKLAARGRKATARSQPARPASPERPEGLERQAPPSAVARPEPPLEPRPPREPLFRLPQIDKAELFGARALAVAGGVVTLLGIVFFFVLAVNRGWVGPVGRVSLGAIASAVVFGSGFELRRRYSDTYASLAAVGVGIAGGFATLLAAAALYDLLPAYAALLVCAAIAAVALATALAWRSQLVAGFGLIGAMLVPVAVVAQSGLSVLGTSFVAVLLAATAIVSLRYRWRELLAAGCLVSLPQIAALTAQADYHGQAPGRVVTLVAVFSLLYLGTGIAYQLRIEGPALEQVSTTLITGAGFLAAASVVRLFGSSTGQGAALLVVTLVYALAAALFWARRDTRDLSAYLGAVGLTLAAVGLAYLFSGQPLAYVWAAEAAALAWLARRLREVRYQVWSAAYLLLTLGHVLIVDAPPHQLLAANDHPAAGAATAVALALALLVFERYARPWPERFESRGGLYGLIAPYLATFEDAHAILRSAALWAGGALGAYGASLGALGLFSSFDWGHVAVAAIWGLSGLAIVVVGLRRDVAEHSRGGVLWLAISSVVLVARGFGASAEQPRSWTFLVVAAALASAAFAYQLLHRRPNGVPTDIAAALAAGGVGLGAIAAGGILSGQPLVFAWAIEAVALAWLARRTQAPHLQVLSVGTLGLALGHVLTLDAPPSQYVTASAHPAHGVAAAFVVAIAAAIIAFLASPASAERYLYLHEIEVWLAANRNRIRAGELWLGGVVATYATSLVVLAVVPSFGWGHVATACLWSAIGLAVVLVGLRRSSRHLAIGGLVWLTVAAVALVAHGSRQLEGTPRSWSYLVLAAALLAAGHANQLKRWPQTLTVDPISAGFVAASLLLSVDAVVVLLHGRAGAIDPEGAALLALAAVYSGLAAAVFRRSGQRDYRTLLWAIGLGLGAAAAGLLLDGTPLVLAWSVGGAVVAWLAVRTGERRLHVGSGVLLVLALGHAVVVQCPPSHLFSVRLHPGGGALAVLIVAAAVGYLAHTLTGEERLVRRMQLSAWCLAGVLAVYGLSLEILDLTQRAFPHASLSTSFQRGHTAVSAFWGLLGLALLYAGLKRWRPLRIAGLVVLATSLAKIFLYDLPSLSSVTRALSFLAVGAVLLLGGFFYQRLSATFDERGVDG